MAKAVDLELKGDIENLLVAIGKIFMLVLSFYTDGSYLGLV